MEQTAFFNIFNINIDKNIMIISAVAAIVIILLFLLRDGGGSASSSAAALNAAVDKRYFNKKIKFLAKTLKTAPLAEYKASDNVKDAIKTSYCDQTAIKKLVLEIFNHFGIPFNNMEIRVEFDEEYSRFSSGGPAGTYSEYADGSKAILVVLKPSYGLDEIIAIVCHECSHAFLLGKGIKIEPVGENEMLTDITAIYLGCGKYLLKGYAPINRVSTKQTANSQIMSIRSSSIGYIKLPQCRYVYKKVCRLRKGYGAGRKIG